jgi:prevent-host-death family protein
MDSWQASVARSRLADIIDRAVDGRPQFIQRRDGKEVVVVSREYYERTRDNLKSYLLGSGYSGPGEDAFDEIIEGIRGSTAGAFAPRRSADED